MPIARIEVRRSRPAHEVQAFIEAVIAAQCEALKAPEDDRQVRYIEHKPEHFAVPPGRSQNYTFVETNIFPETPSQPSVRCIGPLFAASANSASRPPTCSSFYTNHP